MSTELTTNAAAPGSDLTAQMDYARAVSGAAMLPQAYRGKPADIMLAVGLGQSMGLAPAEALYRIDVIQGTPTASAELIASNVRKAGHTLRVRVDEAAGSVTATIIRRDDPDYEHTVVRDMAWAKQMGLDKKDNYRKQPLTMLQWRAVTAVARLAASEALYGVGHTADEVRDTVPSAAPTVTADAFTAHPTSGGTPEAAADTGEAPDQEQLRRMFALFDERRPDLTNRDNRLRYCSLKTDTDITSSADMTAAHVAQVITALEDEPTQAELIEDDGDGAA